MTALVRVPRLPWGNHPGPVDRYLARLSDGSRVSQESALNMIAEMLGASSASFPWHVFTTTAAAKLRTDLLKRYAPRTASRMLSAVRGVLDVCVAERWLVTPVDDGYSIARRDHYDALARELTVKIPKGKRHGRLITDGEVMAMITACGSLGLRGKRDAAIIALGIGAGLRREEIADLDVEHVHLDDGRVDVAHGKGDKARTSFLGESGLRQCKRWMDARGSGPGPFLRRISTMGTLCDDGIGGRAVWETLIGIREKAGVVKFTPHDMRRTCTTKLLRSGVPIHDVQIMLGHESIETTRRYDLSDLDDIQRAVQKVNVKFGDDDG